MQGYKLSNIYCHLFHFYHRTDLSKWDYAPQIHKKIYGVYHVYCINDWKPLVKSQITALKDSGLFAITNALYVSCIISEEKDTEFILDIIGRDKCKIISKEYEGSMYEFPALEFIHKKSQQEDFLVYYFHTKGVSYSEKDGTYFQDRNISFRKKCAFAWRNMMEYFIFYKKNVAINVLSDYDTYGACFFSFRKVRYFNGNFWWSKSSYIKKIPQISDENKKNRYWAEAWLCQQTRPERCFNAFSCLAGLFDNEIPQCIYRNDIKIEIRKVLTFVYGYYTKGLPWLIREKLKMFFSRIKL